MCAVEVSKRRGRTGRVTWYGLIQGHRNGSAGEAVVIGMERKGIALRV